MRKIFDVKFIIFFLVFLLVISIPFIFFYFNNKNIYLKKARIYMAKKDIDNAEKYYIKYANKGNAEDKLVLANVYYDKFNNIDKYLEWYEKAANDGNIEAQLKVADMYYNGETPKGKSIEKNIEKSITFYEKYVNSNKNTKDVNLQIELAEIYINKIYDIKEAIKLYEKAAKNNSVDAMVVLSEIYGKVVDSKEELEEVIKIDDHYLVWIDDWYGDEEGYEEESYKRKKKINIVPDVNKRDLFLEKAFNLLLSKKEFSSAEEKKHYAEIQCFFIKDFIYCSAEAAQFSRDSDREDFKELLKLLERYKDFPMKFCENLYSFYNTDINLAKLFLSIGFIYKTNEQEFNDSFNKAMNWLKNNKRNFELALMYRYIINTEENLYKARELFTSCANTDKENKRDALVELSRLYKNLDPDRMGGETSYDDVTLKIELLNRRK